MVKIEDTNCIMEITDRCYTGCKYCYKKKSVSSRGRHVAKEILFRRMAWVRTHTNAEDLYFLGGEPLLHPDFIELCEFALTLGFRLNIITSGRISWNLTERRNRDYALDLYKKGLLYMEVSYHFGRNEKAYDYFISQIKSSFLERRENLKKLGRYFEKNFDVNSTIVVGEGHTYESLKAFAAKAMSYAGWKYESKHDSVWDSYRRYFETKDGEFDYEIYSVDDWRGFRIKIRFLGEREIEKTSEGYSVNMPSVGTCAATRSKVEADSIEIPGMLIRADGGMSFPASNCIDMMHPLLNVDIHIEHADVLAALAGSLKQINTHVFIFNRIQATENCDENGNEKECTGCPFGLMCTPCWKMERPWQTKTPQ